MAEQFTVVWPSEKVVPELGVHDVCIGDVPPVTVGGSKETELVAVDTLPTEMSPGHEIWGTVDVGVGPVFPPWPPHPTVHKTTPKLPNNLIRSIKRQKNSTGHTSSEGGCLQ